MTGTDRHSGFPRPVERTDIDPDLVLDAAAQRLARHPDPQGIHLSVVVEGPEKPDPLVVVSEGERITKARLLALTEKFEFDGVLNEPKAVTAAFDRWVDSRPVSDQNAADRGIATLGWSDRQSRIAWRVVVPRPSGVNVDWVPTVHTSTERVASVREAAVERAGRLTVTALPTGDVTLWVYLVNPALSTAVLTQPEMLADGHSLEDLYAVFTPGRPVAVGTYVAAQRLTEESSDPHQMLPLADIKTLGWM